jgi:cysteine synthase
LKLSETRPWFACTTCRTRRVVTVLCDSGLRYLSGELFATGESGSA